MYFHTNRNKSPSPRPSPVGRGRFTYRRESIPLTPALSRGEREVYALSETSPSPQSSPVGEGGLRTVGNIPLTPALSVGEGGSRTVGNHPPHPGSLPWGEGGSRTVGNHPPHPEKEFPASSQIINASKTPLYSPGEMFKTSSPALPVPLPAAA